MGSRVQLHTVLCGILECPDRGDACRAYFQPPASKEIQYPCIVYERSEIDAVHADNAPYRLLDRYQVTVIYKNPDSDLPHRIAMLPMCAHDRHFTADNLNHEIFNLYY